MNEPSAFNVTVPLTGGIIGVVFTVNDVTGFPSALSLSFGLTPVDELVTTFVFSVVV